MSPTNPIRLAAALVATAALVAATGCGSDDDGSSGGGSTEEFCDEFASIAETDALDTSALQDVADAAPDEISGAMDQFVEIATQLEDFDEDNATEDDLAEFFTQLEDLEESSVQIEAFLVENCPDLPPGFVSEE